MYSNNCRQNTSKHRDLSSVTDDLSIVGIYRVEQDVKNGNTKSKGRWRNERQIEGKEGRKKLNKNKQEM